MEINTRIVQDIVILDLSGESTPKDEGSVRKVVGDYPGRDVLFNMGGELIAAAIKVMGGGGRIGVFNYKRVQPFFQKILTPPWYGTTYKNERKAIAAFTSQQ